MHVDPNDVKDIKNALAANGMNLGVGVLHVPDGRIYLVPFDDVPGGHDEVVARFGLNAPECKGFAIGKDSDGFVVVNNSHLNGTQGQPGSLLMPQVTFDQIVQTLRNAGL